MSPVDYIDAVAKFPGSGLFAQVQNGKQNPMHIVLHNGASSDITLVGASASFHDPLHLWKTLRNASETKFAASVLANSNVSFPFSIYSDFKPREVGLTVWVDILDAGKEPHRVTAYNSTVNVVEPPASFFDPSLIFLYIILAAIGAYLANFAYRIFAGPAPRAKNAGRKGDGRKVVVPVTAEKPYPESVKPYEEEWIPSHLLSSTKKRKGKSGAAIGTSIDEGFTSGGGEGKKSGKGKGKKA